MQAHVLAMVRPIYPNVSAKVTKRAILAQLRRAARRRRRPDCRLRRRAHPRDAEGLWIPNTEIDFWDASHPEKHTELFTSGSRKLRRTAPTPPGSLRPRTSAPPPRRCVASTSRPSRGCSPDGLNDAAALLALWLKGALDLSRRPRTPPACLPPSRSRTGSWPSTGSRTPRPGSDVQSPTTVTRYVREQLGPLWPDFICVWRPVRHQGPRRRRPEVQVEHRGHQHRRAHHGMQESG